MPGSSLSVTATHGTRFTRPNLREAANESPLSLATDLRHHYELQLTNIHAVDKSNLWALGRERGGGALERAVLLRTSDGGQSWERQLNDTEKWFYEVYFISTQIGWLAGYDGLILKSTDGGKSWTRQEAPTRSSLIEIRFFNSDWGWVLGHDGEFLHTSDGGRNWRSYRLKGQGWVRRNSPGDKFQGRLLSFDFSDKFHGWIIGEGGKASQSTDGGVSWQERGDELVKLVKGQRNSQVEFVAVRFINRQLGFITGNILTGKRDERFFRGVVFRTQDGGHTWTLLKLGKNVGLGNSQFMNENEAWAITERGSNLVHTGDGGKSWSSIPAPPGGADLLKTQFVDSNNGWLLVSYGIFFDEIFRTFDGGKTWIAAKLPAN